MRFLTVLLAAGLLSACARPADRIANTLTGYGLDQERADCVGEYLEARLSLGQLLELRTASNRYRKQVGGKVLSFPHMLAVGATLDPTTQSTLFAAGVSCAIPPSMLIPAPQSPVA